MPGDGYYDGCYVPPQGPDGAYVPPRRPIQRPGESLGFYNARVEAFNVKVAPYEESVRRRLAEAKEKAEKDRHERRVNMVIVPVGLLLVALTIGIIYLCWPLISAYLLFWVFRDTFFHGGIDPNPWRSTRLRRQHDWLWGARGGKGFGHTSDGAGTGDGI